MHYVLKTRDLYDNVTEFSEGVLNNVTFAIILHQLYGPQFWEYLWERVCLGIEWVNLKQEFSKLVDYLCTDKPVILGLGPNNKHAVVAWRIDRESDSRHYIYTSDPNYPS